MLRIAPAVAREVVGPRILATLRAVEVSISMSEISKGLMLV